MQPTQHKLDIQFSLLDPSELIFSLNFRVYVSLLCILLISALCFLRWYNPVQNNEIQFEFLFLHLRCSGLDSSSSIAGLHQCSLPVMEFCTKLLFFPACTSYFAPALMTSLGPPAICLCVNKKSCIFCKMETKFHSPPPFLCCVC